MMDYTIKNSEDIVSPSLIYFRKGFEENTRKVADVCGGAEYLWPHIKTHKCVEMVKYQLSCGIERFKCATIAELEMVCEAGAKAAILAMSPAGPTPRRFMEVKMAFPETDLYGIVDCVEHINAYSKAAAEYGVTVNLLVDVNLGLNRTGLVPKCIEKLYEQAKEYPFVHLCGMHCYDGERHEPDAFERQRKVDISDRKVFEVRHRLQENGYDVRYMVMGGSPSFPCHVKYYEDGVFFSPGTLFLNDASYYEDFKDLDMEPAAAILCRVISHPCEGRFAVDCGVKAIASDPKGPERGRLVGVENCYPVLQNEEHWVFQMTEGHENEVPEIGKVLYAIPMHICPCAMLYPEVLIAEDGEIVDKWTITARDRKITY